MTIAPVLSATPRVPRANPSRPRGIPWMLAAEVVSGALGFVAALHLARRLGPDGFATLEWASAVAAWLLVVVRGGVESIVFREAARRPRLIRPMTDLLLGMKCALAMAAYAIVLILAANAGVERGGPMAVAGLILFPSALAADVGPRALERLGVLALAQTLRAIGFATAAWLFVSGPGQAIRAAWCAVGAEGIACLVTLRWHASRYELPRPRFRRRAWWVFAGRGAVASLSRFARVSLYGADLLLMGWWALPGLGPYAAARRIVFALVAVGLVVPASVAPAIARAWAEGRDSARRVVGLWFGWLMELAIPAAVGLAITSARWMPLLFGANYAEGGPWLAILAARLPWLLAAGSWQATLLACRREGRGLALTAGMTAMAAILIPISGAAGPFGVGLATMAVEMAGAAAGWRMLRGMGIAPPLLRRGLGIGLGCLGLMVGCFLARGSSLAFACPAGALAYILGRLAGKGAGC